MGIRLKRAYEEPAVDDGYRVLVDRLWPRGLNKEEAHIDLWLKEVAPSPQLRRWFGHDASKWVMFKQRYFSELKRHPDSVELLKEKHHRKTVTLVFAARDEDHNNAVALKEYLEKQAG